MQSLESYTQIVVWSDRAGHRVGAGIGGTTPAGAEGSASLLSGTHSVSGRRKEGRIHPTLCNRVGSDFPGPRKLS